MTRASIYTEVKGCTAHVNGERGTTVLILWKPSLPEPVGALVRLNERPAMLHLTLGRITGERGAHSEIESVREIDRDGFDEVTGLAEVRTSMGWTL